MAELSERKEVSGGRAILGWDVAVDRAAWLRFRYAFWGGFAAWALLHLSPLDGSRHMPATFGEAVWLVITAVLAGLAAAGFVGLVAVARKDAVWLRDYWMETFSVTEKAAPPEPSPTPATRASNGRPVFVPSNDGATVAHGNQSYRFSQRQLRLMQDRIETGELGVARDAFNITGADYITLRGIMASLGYWSEDRGRYSWSDAGLAWLADQMRVMHV
jgi:hypothetical protein